MRGWMHVLRVVHDNITLIFFALLVATFVVAWLVIEAIRSHRSRDEIFRLRRRLGQLEQERLATRSPSPDPVVLPNRWVRIGGAATTSDGGCLILVEKVSAAQRVAILSVRVDGLPVLKSEPVRVSEHFELPGKSGTYLVELYGTDGIQAQLGVSLRSKHFEYLQDTNLHHG
jgi:hypothetical protein